jgi:hypothetical protein
LDENDTKAEEEKEKEKENEEKKGKKKGSQYPSRLDGMLSRSMLADNHQRPTLAEKDGGQGMTSTNASKMVGGAAHPSTKTMKIEGMGTNMKRQGKEEGRPKQGEH